MALHVAVATLTSWKSHHTPGRDQVVPSPIETHGVLWTLTALPSTNRSAGWQRLSTLSVGRLEILRVFEDTYDGQPQIVWYLNLHPEAEELRVEDALSGARVIDSHLERVAYKAEIKPILTVNGPDLGALLALLDDTYILDEVYRLVVSLMRQGINPLRRFHNPRFAADVLAR